MTTQAERIVILQSKGYHVTGEEPNGAVTMIRPAKPVRDGRHLAATVATGGLWLMSGNWAQAHMAPHHRVTVEPDRPDARPGSEASPLDILVGLAMLFAILAGIALVVTFWRELLIALVALGAARLVFKGWKRSRSGPATRRLPGTGGWVPPAAER